MQKFLGGNVLFGVFQGLERGYCVWRIGSGGIKNYRGGEGGEEGKGQIYVVVQITERSLGFILSVIVGF